MLIFSFIIFFYDQCKLFGRFEKGATVGQLVTPSSALSQSNRANQSSKVSGETANKPSPPSHISKELPGTQQTRNREAEERLDDEVLDFFWK